MGIALWNYVWTGGRMVIELDDLFQNMKLLDDLFFEYLFFLDKESSILIKICIFFVAKA